MRDHAECDEAIAKAMREDRPGKAEYLAARCDLKHGPTRADLREQTQPTTKETATAALAEGSDI